jgi:hypothetical protein
MSSSPLIYDYPAQIAQMAGIPLTQAQTQQTQANTQQIQTQTQGAQLANQQAALQYKLFQNALLGIQGNTADAAPSGSGLSSSDLDAGTGNPQMGATGVGSDDVAQAAFSKYAPVPTAPPPNVMRQAMAFAMAGHPQTAAAIKAQWDAGVANTNQNKQKDATQAYVVAQMVSSAPPGVAFAVLRQVNPNSAAALKAKYPDDSDAQLDQDTRLFAQHIGAAVHQYTGRPTTMTNGVLIDQTDGEPVLGTDQVLTGLSAEDKQKAFEAGNELITVNRSDGSTIQIPRWQLIGAHSPEGYVVAADHMARIHANAASNAPPGTPALANNFVNPSATPPSLPGAPAGSAPQPTRNALTGNSLIGNFTPTATRIPTPSAGPMPATAAAPSPPASARPYSNSPTGMIDYSDAPKRYTLPPPKTGATMNDQDKATAAGVGQAYGKALIDTNLQANQNVEAANAEIQGARNSQIALQTAMSGPLSGKIAAFQTALGNPTILQAWLGNPGSRQVLEKTLGVDAVRDIEQEAHGSQFRLGAQTMNMAVNKLAASPLMTQPAIKTMTDAMIANAQYERQKWGPDFLAYKSDPSRDVTAYSAWYSGPNKYPNKTTINAGTLAGKPSASVYQPGVVIKGYRFNGGDPKQKQNWTPVQ